VASSIIAADLSLSGRLSDTWRGLPTKIAENYTVLGVPNEAKGRPGRRQQLAAAVRTAGKTARVEVLDRGEQQTCCNAIPRSAE
jgi:hypothetical protein